MSLQMEKCPFKRLNDVILCVYVVPRFLFPFICQYFLNLFWKFKTSFSCRVDEKTFFTCVCVHVHMHIHVWMHLCAHMRVLIHVWVYLCVCLHVCMFICGCTRMCACACESSHVGHPVCARACPHECACSHVGAPVCGGGNWCGESFLVTLHLIYWVQGCHLDPERTPMTSLASLL